MALSGSLLTNGYYSSSSNDTIYIELVWTATQSIENNTSTISWELRGKRSTSGYVNAGGFKVIIDGETVYSKSTSYRIELRNGTVIASGTKTITHNSNGTRSFKAYIEGAIYYTAVYHSAEQTYTLDTIPRKSSLSVSNGTLGTSQTLSVSKQASSFTHTITYSCGNTSGTICTKDSRTSIPWTPPNELANQAPQGNSVVVNFTITTYSGNTNIGSTPASINCAIPYTGTFVPVLMPTTSDEMGYLTTYGAYIQGQSKLKVEINTYGAYGAWITSVKTEFEGATYTGTSVVSNTIKNSGDVKLKITTTDSRGRSTISETTINVLEYEYPKITSLSAVRCDSNGTPNSSGAYLLAKFTATIYSLNNKNTATYYVGYKKTSDADHTAVRLTDLSGVYSVSSSYVIPAETTSSYTMIFTAVDAFGQSRTTTIGPTAKKVWSLLKKNGEIVGMAFGKIAEHENCFDIGLPVKFSGGGDCVIEKGEKDGWTYRKWDSGVMECWKIHTHTSAISTAWGSLYTSTATARQSYPFPFINKPTETVTLLNGNYGAWLCAESGDRGGVNGAYASAQYLAVRPTSTSNTCTFYFSFYVTGKWK